jgi:DnaK suppressor protein
VRAVHADHEDKRLVFTEERQHLLQQIDELTVGGQVDLDFDDDFSDRSLVASEQGENRSLASVLQAQLNLVERALARLDDGSYGTCEICSNLIGAARLEALPATSYCIDHADNAPQRSAKQG